MSDTALLSFERAPVTNLEEIPLTAISGEETPESLMTFKRFPAAASVAAPESDPSVFESVGGWVKEKGPEIPRALAQGLDQTMVAVGGLGEMVSLPGAEQFKDYWKQRAERPEIQRPEYLREGTIVQHPERLIDPVWWFRTLGENAPNMVLMMAGGAGVMGVGKAAGMGAKGLQWAGRTGAFSGAFTLEAGNAYNDAKEELLKMGKSEEDASSIARVEGAVVGTLNGVLEVLPFDNLMFPKAKKAMAHIIRQAMLEGSTEMAQESISMIAAELMGHKPDEDWQTNLGRILESGITGTVMGGGVATIEGPKAGSENVTPDNNKPPELGNVPLPEEQSNAEKLKILESQLNNPESAVDESVIEALIQTEKMRPLVPQLKAMLDRYNGVQPVDLMDDEFSNDPLAGAESEIRKGFPIEALRDDPSDGRMVNARTGAWIYPDQPATNPQGTPVPSKDATGLQFRDQLPEQPIVLDPNRSNEGLSPEEQYLRKATERVGGKYTPPSRDTGLVDEKGDSILVPVKEATSESSQNEDQGLIVDAAGIPFERAPEKPVVPTAKEIDTEAHEAATSPKNDVPEPTEGQIKAGNYQKGHIRLHGVDISVENPKGSTRKGTSPDGKKWQSKLTSHYGQILGVKGADGDLLDVFVGPKPESEKIFVVDQVDPKTGEFDEHKVLMGFETKTAAKFGYLSNYEKGWQGLGNITELSPSDFKSWTKFGDQQKSLTKGIPSKGKTGASALTVKETEGEGGVQRFEYSNAEGEVVGSARMMGSTIGDIEVEEEYRRKGYGSQILKDLKQRGGESAYAGTKEGKALMQKGGMTADSQGLWSFDKGVKSKANQFKLETGERKVLVNRGFTQNQINRMSVKEARSIIEKGTAAVYQPPGPRSGGEVVNEKVENRRANDDFLRKKIDELTPEEMRYALKTDYLTGLGNKRAYDESDKKPVQTSIDMDSMKYINDTFGHGSGDELLKAVGKAFEGEGAYRVGGDEIIIQGNSTAEVDKRVQKAYDYLNNNPIQVIHPDGNTFIVKGSFSYGTGKTFAEADVALREHKGQREVQGERAPRGEKPPGVSKYEPARNESDNKREDVHKEVKNPPKKESAPVKEEKPEENPPGEEGAETQFNTGPRDPNEYPSTWSKKLVKSLTDIRSRLARGSLKEDSAEFLKYVAKYGAKLRLYQLKHNKGSRFLVSKDRWYGPLRATDVKYTVEKQGAFGKFTTTEYWDRPKLNKKGKLNKRAKQIIPGPIFAKDKYKRRKEMAEIVAKNKESVTWYEEWNSFMRGFESLGIPAEKITKYIKIQAILSAQAGPQSNMLKATDLIDKFNAGKKIQFGRLEDGKDGINPDQYAKIMEIWEGKDNYETMGARIARYGEKVGQYMTLGLYPHEDGVVIDRHMPRPWGYNVGWSKNMYTDFHLRFVVHKAVAQEITDDILAVSKETGVSTGGVQAAIWFESRLPDVEAASYSEAAVLGKQYVPKDMREATMAPSQYLVHYSREVRDVIRGSGLEEDHQSYSNGDVGAQKDMVSKEYPYRPIGYFYTKGAKPESVVYQGGKPHLVRIDERVYDGLGDPLRLVKTAKKIWAKKPDIHYTNILTTLLTNNDYKGIVYRSTNGEAWAAMMGETKVVAAPVEVGIRMSDVTEDTEIIPQNLEDLNAIAPERARTLEFELRKALRKDYPEVKIIHSGPTMARFGGATSGQMESGLGLKLAGPLPAIRAAMSELVGLGKHQNMIFIEGPAEVMGQKESNVATVKFKFKKDMGVKEIESALEKHGFNDYNIEKSGSGYYFDLTLFDGEGKDSVTALFDEVGQISTLSHTEVYSEDLSTGDGYKGHILEYWKDKQGEKRYEEAKRQGDIHLIRGSKRNQRTNRALKEARLQRGKGRGDQRKDLPGQKIGTRLSRQKPTTAQLKGAKASIEQFRSWLKAAGLPKEVVDKIEVEANKVIKLIGDYSKSEKEHKDAGHSPDAIGATTFFDNARILIQYAADQSLILAEDTAYHEAFHVMLRTLVPEADSAALLKHFKGNEEQAARAYARFVTNKETSSIPRKIRKIFWQIKKALYRLGRAFKRSEYKSVDHFFNDLYFGDYAKTAAKQARTGTQASKTAKPFFSQLIKTVEDNIKQMPGKSMALVNWLKKKQVKPAEMKWMGVEQWIKDNAKDGKIDKEKFLKFLKANEIHVRETTKGFDEDITLTEDDFYSGFTDYEFQEPDATDIQYHIDLKREELIEDGYDRENFENDHEWEAHIEELAQEWGPYDAEEFSNRKVKTHIEAGVEIIHDIDVGTWTLRDIDDGTYLGDYDSDANAEFGAMEYAQENGMNIVDEYQETKYDSYVLPSGKNYRELLFTLPEFKNEDKERYKELVMKQEREDGGLSQEEWKEYEALHFSRSRTEDVQYRSPHWNTPNVLAHVRFNEREDAQGNKVLFIEEIQSDWHQEGKKKGYSERVTEFNPKWTIEKTGNNDYGSIIWTLKDEKGKVLSDAIITDDGSIEKAKRAAVNKLNRNMFRYGSVPMAPFKDNWHEVVFKRMLRHAAENGFDKLAWTTGEQQAERYDLSKQVDNIYWEKHSQGFTIVANKNQEAIFERKGLSETALEEHIGKEAAKKIVESSEDLGQLEGLDLKVGGEGMASFYDNLLPGFAKKYGKQWGAKVGMAEVGVLGMTGPREYKGPDVPADQLIDKISEAYKNDKQEAKRLYDQANTIALALQVGSPFKSAMENYASIALAEVYGGTLVTPWIDPKVHYIPITDAMRKSVVLKGQTWFNKEDAVHNFYDKVSSLRGDIVQEFRGAGKEEHQEWGLLPEGRVKKIWEDYAQTGFVRDVRGLDAIADRVVNNIAKLTANTELAGHTPADPQGILKEQGIKAFSDEEYDNFIDWMGDSKTGQMRISDYALDDLNDDAVSILTAKTSEEKLLAIDAAFNRIHQRSDISKMFVENGNSFLADLSGQGDTKFNTGPKAPQAGKRNKAPGKKVDNINAFNNEVNDFLGFPEASPEMEKSMKETPVGDHPDIISEKFGSKPKSVSQKLKEGLESIKHKDWWDRLATLNFDRLHPIKTNIDEKTYRLHRLSTGSQATIAMLLRHGKLRWEKSGLMTVDTRNEGFLPFLEGLGKDREKFLYWVVARRAEQLEMEGRERWLSAEDRDKIFEWTGGRQRKKWVEAAKVLRDFNENVLDIAQEAGLINKASREAWDDEFYVPFYRVFDDEQERHTFLTRPDKISSQVKRLVGGEEKLGDPTENLLKNWMHLISESMRNKARSSAYEFAVQSDSGLIEKVESKDLNIYRNSKDKKMVYVTNNKDNVLMYQDKGKPVYFKVNDPALFQAMSDLNVPALDNFIMKLMNKSKKALTYGATFGPGFRIANALRDTLHTSLVNKSFKPLIDTAKGTVKAWREDKDYIAFMASGAGFGSSYIRAENPKEAADYVKRILKKEGKGAMDRILNTPKKMLDFWEKIGSVSENAARVQLYKNLMDKGDSHEEAAFQARDLLDFTMRGEANVVQFLIQTIPFLNARMQGLYKLGKVVADKDTRTNFLVRGTMLAAASMALWALNSDDDRYKELQDWDRWSYYHFWIGNLHFRIPKPFEVGAIFSSLPESILDAMSDNEDASYVAKMLGYTAVETFSISFPQLFMPLAEQWANKSSYTGNAIVSPGLKKLKASEQYQPWTSETLQLAGKLGISPKRAEALIQGYFGTLGTFILGASDIVIKNLFDFPEEPTKIIDDYPAIGRFVKRGGPTRYTKQQTWFYNTFDEIDRTTRTIKHFQATGEYEQAASLRNKNIDKIKYKTYFNVVRKQLSTLNSTIKKVMRKDISAEEKRKRLDELTVRRNALVKRAYELMNK